MANKPHQQHSGDDWAGLAQNLFGINLDKPASGDDDLLDDDMFKVELPKPPAPPPVIVAAVTQPAAPIAQEEIEFAPAEPAPHAPARATTVAASRPSPAKAAPASKPIAAKAPPADSFGAGVDDFGSGVVEPPAAAMLLAASDAEEDDGITLPEDYDSEGLTLPADYDDGLTLAPELVAEADFEFEDGDDLDDDEELSASDEDDEFEDEDTEEDSDDEEAEASSDEPATAELGATGTAADRSKRRPQRRTREDAYWDMLENWQWEEIPDSDAPRADAGRSPSGRDRDRKGSGGRGRNDRGSRGGSDRPRGDRPREDRPQVSSSAPVAERPRDSRPTSEDRPRSPERAANSDAPRERSADGSGDRSRPPRSGDRGRQDRPREERPRQDARPPAGIAPVSRSSIAPTVASSESDDFGLGIFDNEPKATAVSAPTHERRPREEAVAQSTVAADKVLRTPAHDTPRARPVRIEEELVWPDADDSDVQQVPEGSVSETTAFPSAKTADESDESSESGDGSSDVMELNEDGSPRRSRRRRRRRRRPGETSAESGSESANSDRGEGTTFDLNEALADSSEAPDFIPATAAEDSAFAESEDNDSESEEVAEQSEGEQTGERRGRRRRRRRRRPDAVNGEGESAVGSTETTEQLGTDFRVESAVDVDDLADDDEDDEDDEVPVITYAKMPSWEEAIRYLLNPHMVGKNLDPVDEAESLVGDPRGSGGSEPVAAPPQRRFRRGGGRGRR